MERTKPFTEKGLYMLATILKSKQATEATFAIIETFSKIRQLSKSIQELSIVQDKPDMNFFDPPYYTEKQRNTRKKQAKQRLPYHPMQKRTTKGFLKTSSPWPTKTQNQQPPWPF